MNTYKRFSYYYDDAISEIDYSLWLEFIEPYLKKDSAILDLACGSGTLAILLKLKGYDVEGLDLSDSIIEIAREKSKINHLHIPYYVMNMTDFSLDKKYDVITCFFDSINFLASEAEVKRLFDSVKKHLKKDGLFICDVFSMEMLNEYENNLIEKTFQTYKLTWLTKKVTPTQIVHSIVIDDNLSGETFNENYSEYFYDLEKLSSDSFTIERISGDFNDDVIPGDERLLFVLKAH